MGREPGAAVMSALEGRAEAEAGTFNAQAVANTLWAYATMGREPGAAVMSELEGRAEAVEGTFNTQVVANTLRAYATMGRVPVEGLMRALEGRAEAEAGTCNAQAVANTLWAYATMGRVPEEGLMGKMEGGGGGGGHVQRAGCGNHAVGGLCVFPSSRPCGRNSMGLYGCAATGVSGQGCVLQYRAVVPAPSVLCVVQRSRGFVWRRSGTCNL
jgi:hypothetical protein